MTDQNTDILRGWVTIEAYLKLSANTILKNKYPVFREGGTVWANITELNAHRKKISESVNAEACKGDEK